MSTNAPRRPRVEKGKRTFQIVASQFNAQYVQGLVAHAAEELHELAPGRGDFYPSRAGIVRNSCGGARVGTKEKSGCDYRLRRNHAWRNKPREKSQPFRD